MFYFNFFLMKRCVLLVLFSLIIQLVNAQQTDTSITVKKRFFCLSTGYNHMRMYDEQVSPLIYRADVVPLALGFQVITDKKFWGVHAELLPLIGTMRSVNYNERIFKIYSPNNNGELEYKESNLKQSGFFQQEINFWFQKRIRNEKWNKSKLFFGGEFKHYFHLAFTPSAVFVMNEMSLNPMFTIIRTINENSTFTSTISFPLTGMLVRLPYANDPADGKHGNVLSTYIMGLNFITPINYQRLNFVFGYNTKLSKKWNIGISYKFNWFHYSKNRGISAYENQFMVSFTKKLKTK